MSKMIAMLVSETIGPVACMRLEDKVRSTNKIAHCLDGYGIRVGLFHPIELDKSCLKRKAEPLTIGDLTVNGIRLGLSEEQIKVANVFMTMRHDRNKLESKVEDLLELWVIDLNEIKLPGTGYLRETLIDLDDFSPEEGGPQSFEMVCKETEELIASIQRSLEEFKRKHQDAGFDASGIVHYSLDKSEDTLLRLSATGPTLRAKDDEIFNHMCKKTKEIVENHLIKRDLKHKQMTLKAELDKVNAQLGE